MADPDFVKLSSFGYLGRSIGTGILLLNALFSAPLLAETDFDPVNAVLDLVCLQNEWLSCSLQADILDPQL